MKTVPEELTTLAGACRDGSRTIADEWTTASPGMSVPGAAAGNTAGAGSLLRAHAAAVDAGGVAVGRAVSVLEQDMDDLYQCAFEVSSTDEATAREMAGLAPVGEPGRPGLRRAE